MKYCSSFTVPSNTLRQYFKRCPKNSCSLSPAVEIPIKSLFVYAFIASLKRLYCFGFLNAWHSSTIAMLQFNESCVSGFAASARIKKEPSGKDDSIECSLLLSIIFTEPPFLEFSPILSMLYFKKLKLSKDCIRAAEAI